MITRANENSQFSFAISRHRTADSRHSEMPTRASNENRLMLNVGIAPHALRGCSLVRAPMLPQPAYARDVCFALQTVSSPLPQTLDAFIALCHNVHRYHFRWSGRTARHLNDLFKRIATPTAVAVRRMKARSRRRLHTF